jgi:hypothetical protein
MTHYWVEYIEVGNHRAWIRVQDICRSRYRAELVARALEKRRNIDATRIIPVTVP